MEFDLWDTETSNYFGHFENEIDALELVRKLVTHYGESYAQDLGLGRVTGEGTMLLPLSGAALLARMKAVLSARTVHAERQDAVTTAGVD